MSMLVGLGWEMDADSEPRRYICHLDGGAVDLGGRIARFGGGALVVGLERG